MLYLIKKLYEFNSEELNLFELVMLSTGMFKQSIDAKKLIFNNLLDLRQTIKGDQEIIQFSTRNLIDNAIKYSPVNGIITVTVRMDDKAFVVSVRNDGKGMTEKQLNNLFTFRQQEPSERGAGMALTLSREFITLLNGRIWAESKPGKGGDFLLFASHIV